jgi:hypothetical protein
MRERREIPKIEGGEAGVLILGEGMGVVGAATVFILILGMGEGMGELLELVLWSWKLSHRTTIGS